MIAKLDAAIQQGRSRATLGDGPYSYGFIGRWMMRAMEPPVKRKFKAPKAFVPSTSLVPDAVLDRWTSTHDRIRELLTAANGLNLAGIKVTSPVTSLIKYEIGAGFWIITLHDKRHLWLIRELRGRADFP
jgi:hypothetical protein